MTWLPYILAPLDLLAAFSLFVFTVHRHGPFASMWSLTPTTAAIGRMLLAGLVVGSMLNGTAQLWAIFEPGPPCSWLWVVHRLSFDTACIVLYVMDVRRRHLPKLTREVNP